MGSSAPVDKSIETESAYNYIQVLEINGTRYLRLNEGQGIHSEYNPQTLEYGGPWQQFLVGPFFYADRQPEDIQRIAIVGLAAGTTARQAAAVFPNVVIDGIEIDPKIVDVGQDIFRYEFAQLERHHSGWALGTGKQPGKVRLDLCGCISSSVYPTAPNHAGILPDCRRPPQP